MAEREQSKELVNMGIALLYEFRQSSVVELKRRQRHRVIRKVDLRRRLQSSNIAVNKAIHCDVVVVPDTNIISTLLI